MTEEIEEENRITEVRDAICLTVIIFIILNIILYIITPDIFNKNEGVNYNGKLYKKTAK